jgi:hypothetical protein
MGQDNDSGPTKEDGGVGGTLRRLSGSLSPNMLRGLFSPDDLSSSSDEDEEEMRPGRQQRASVVAAAASAAGGVPTSISYRSSVAPPVPSLEDVGRRSSCCPSEVGSGRLSCPSAASASTFTGTTGPRSINKKECNSSGSTVRDNIHAEGGSSSSPSSSHGLERLGGASGNGSSGRVGSAHPVDAAARKETAPHMAEERADVDVNDDGATRSPLPSPALALAEPSVPAATTSKGGAAVSPAGPTRRWRPILLKALAVAAVVATALCGLAMVSRTSPSGSWYGSMVGFRRGGGRLDRQLMAPTDDSVAGILLSGPGSDATTPEKGGKVAPLGERRLDQPEGGKDQQEEEADGSLAGRGSRNIFLASSEGYSSPLSSTSKVSPDERTARLVKTRRRRRWIRLWQQSSTKGNGKKVPRKRPTREAMRKFRAAFRLYRRRYFKWTNSVGEEGREECTFDDINFSPVVADSKGGSGPNKINNIFDSKSEDSKDEGGDGPLKVSSGIFGGSDDNVKGKGEGKGKGKGKGYYAGRDESDDFIVKQSTTSKESKGSKSVRTCISCLVAQYSSSSSFFFFFFFFLPGPYVLYLHSLRIMPFLFSLLNNNNNVQCTIRRILRAKARAAADIGRTTETTATTPTARPTTRRDIMFSPTATSVEI